MSTDKPTKPKPPPGTIAQNMYPTLPSTNPRPGAQPKPPQGDSKK
jgi:hypothetical protein